MGRASHRCLVFGKVSETHDQGTASVLKVLGRGETQEPVRRILKMVPRTLCWERVSTDVPGRENERRRCPLHHQDAMASLIDTFSGPAGTDLDAPGYSCLWGKDADTRVHPRPVFPSVLPADRPIPGASCPCPRRIFDLKDLETFKK